MEPEGSLPHSQEPAASYMWMNKNCFCCCFVWGMKHACRLDCRAQISSILKRSGEILAATTDELSRKGWLMHDPGPRDLQYSPTNGRSGKTESET
jgi:hypothetical protein